MTEGELLAQIAFGLVVAIGGSWSFRRGWQGLRRDWRLSSPWIDRWADRAIAPATLPPKSFIDHILARAGQAAAVIGGAFAMLAGIGLIVFRIISILSE